MEDPKIPPLNVTPGNQTVSSTPFGRKYGNITGHEAHMLLQGEGIGFCKVAQREK